MVISLLLRIYLYLKGYVFDPWTYRFFPTELFFFLLGSIAYKMYLKIKKLDLTQSKLEYSFVGMLIIVSIFSLLNLPEFSASYFDYLFIACISLLLPFLFLVSKNWSFDKIIGELSYPIYISHILIINLVNTFSVGSSSQGQRIIIIITITIMFSVLLNKLITEKIDRYREKRYNLSKQEVVKT